MDTLTHALLGTAISDAGFRRRLGPVATPFAFVVGALPDADIVAFMVSPEYGWIHHRGYTHSLLPMVLASPLFGYLGYRLARKAATWAQWTLLALLALFSHTFLDVVTSWGTMPFLPFSNARVSWDLAPIVDVFVFSVLGASFVLNRLLRWEKVEHFLNPLAYPLVHEHPGRRRAADIIARICVCLFAVYMLVGWQQNRQTVRIAREELAAAGFEPVEVRFIPHLLTYISGNVTARDAAGNIRVAFYSTFAPGPMRFRSYPAADGDLARSALASQWGRLFNWYAQGMVEAREEGSGQVAADAGAGAPPLPDGGRRVRLIDRRFATLADPDGARFTMAVDFDADGTARSGRAVATRPALDNIREELDRLWRLTRYGEAGD